VRTDRYQHIGFERGRKPWLFDLQKDPGALNNLIDTKEREKILPDLRALLGQLKK
jgi:hypothetical protein